jgi:GNAT superfamily N-acetyltransferase
MFLIRKIVPADLVACAEIDRTCVAPAWAWSWSDFADFLATSGNGGHVAAWDGGVIGFLLHRAERPSRRLQLCRIGVSAAWRRCQVGSRLVQHVREWLRVVPNVKLCALIHERQLPMQCFLRANGFQAVRICKGCCDEGASDAYWFEASVDDTALANPGKSRA